jgi:energy-coupling factor transporter transmembrane protein EcfT
MALLSLFSAVTPLSDVIRTVDRALAPFDRIGLPGRELSTIAGIALRFVPVLVEEAERIAVAQLSRGGGYTGKGRLRAALAMIVPIFLRALERSEALAVAMELRLYTGSRPHVRGGS